MYNECPGCGVIDYGFDLHDERERILLDLENFEEDEEFWSPVWIKIVIDRYWGVPCPADCGGMTYECRYRLIRKNRRDLIVDSLTEAIDLANALRLVMHHSKEKLKEMARYEKELNDWTPNIWGP